MPLNQELPGQHQFIRSVGSAGVQLAEHLLQDSFILTPEQVYPHWPITHVDQLDEAAIDHLLQLKPELVVLGTGAKQVFPPAALLGRFLQQGVGIEIMNTDAACRTFNICVMENRRIVAALILEPGI